eukprot:gene4212-4461_t
MTPQTQTLTNSKPKTAITNLRNLVVAVDHTVGSYKAVKWTLEHLYREGDVLHLLHVVPASSMLMPQPFGLASALPPEEGLQDCMAAHAQQFFETNFVQLAQRFGATCELDLVHGACNQAVSQTICKKVEDLSAAVVVLTEYKRGLLDGIFQAAMGYQEITLYQVAHTLLPAVDFAMLCSIPSPSLRGKTILNYSIPDDDFDSALISRRAFSSLEQPSSHPLPRADSASSSSTGSISEDSETGGLSVEEVLEHKKAAIQQAFLNDSLGFGFSAGGLIFPYYVGLVSSLVQCGVLSRPAQLAGSSAGSLIAASFNAGLDMATVEKSMIDFGEDCLKNGTRYRLGPLLKDFLQQYLPPDAHEKCSGSTHVAVTRLLPFWQTQMVSHFESRDDLISALMTSCHIPWYFDGRWMTKFRGHYCVDGGVMAFIPTVPEAEYSVKRSTRSSRRLKKLHDLLDIDITMDRFEHWPHDLTQILKWALVASAQETSSLLIDKGKRDATSWAEGEGAPEVAQSADAAGAMGGAGSAAAGTAPVDQEAAAAWSDHKQDAQRQEEARRAQDLTSQAEKAAAKESGRDVEGRVRLGDVAAAAGVEEHVLDHAEDAADLAGHAAKRRKVEQVTGSTVAAAAEGSEEVAAGIRAAAAAVAGKATGTAGDSQKA